MTDRLANTRKVTFVSQLFCLFNNRIRQSVKFSHGILL
jgi:hypothetical protein